MKYFNVKEFKSYLKAESMDNDTINKFADCIEDFLTYGKRRPFMSLNEFNKKVDKQLYEMTFLKPNFKNMFSIKLTSMESFSWKNIKIKIKYMFEKLKESLGDFEYFIWTYAISDIEYEVYLCLYFDKTISRKKINYAISREWYSLDKIIIMRVYEITQLLSFIVKLKDRVNEESKNETTYYLKSSKLFMMSQNFGRNQVNNDIDKIYDLPLE